jgi:tripartite ATP-independent transporter DctM subunit
VSPTVIILLGLFIALMLLRVPIAFALGLAAVAAALQAHLPLGGLATRVANSLDSFPLMAIPFFVLAGEIMAHGGTARRLIALAGLVVGAVRGGLALVNIAASMFFGGISGSSVADTSCIGSIMIPMMEEEGYDTDFSVALTVSGSTQGLIIPPSHNAVIYSLAAGGSVSVGALFLGGAIPGVLIGVGLAIAVVILARVRHFPKRMRRLTAAEALVTLRGGALDLLTPIIIVGGIISGVFTATEAAAVAVVYAFLLTFVVHRELPWRALPEVLGRAVVTISLVLILIATSSAFGQILTLERVPERLTTALVRLSSNPVVLLLIINAGLLVVGLFMDMAPAILILTPILLPVVKSIGMQPVHFGIVLMMNLGIGLCTPPVGASLFVGCAIGKISIERATRALLVLYPAMVAILLLVTYVPALTLWLPGLVWK